MSTAFILDCSIAVSWCFEDEATTESDALLDRLRDYGAIVPVLWMQEIANVMVMAERRRRITRTQMANNLELLAALPISIEEIAGTRIFGAIAELARTEKLSVYDATYLDIAMRLNLPLATHDKGLIRACRTVGTEHLPE